MNSLSHQRGKILRIFSLPCLGQISFTLNQTANQDNSKEPQTFYKGFSLEPDDVTTPFHMWILGSCEALSRTTSRLEEEKAFGDRGSCCFAAGAAEVGWMSLITVIQSWNPVPCKEVICLLSVHLKRRGEEKLKSLRVVFRKELFPGIY